MQGYLQVYSRYDRTTVKVPIPLRDRLASGAKAERRSIAAYLSDVLDEHDRRARMARLGAAIRDTPADDEYWTEFATLDQIGGGADG